MITFYNKPVIEHMLLRVKKAKLLDEIWLAASNNEIDNYLKV